MKKKIKKASKSTPNKQKVKIVEIVKQGNLTREDIFRIELNLAKVLADVKALQALPQIPGTTGAGLGKMATLALDSEKLLLEVKLLKGWNDDAPRIS